MPVKINGTTSGSVTLAAPATGSDVTLTLPTTALATESFVSSSYLPIAGGKILQVVRATDATARTTTSGSYVDVTGMSVTITPQRNTSKILVIASYFISGSGSPGACISFARITTSGGTALSGAEDAHAGSATSGSHWAHHTLIGYAEPATTSAVTYKLQFKAFTGFTAQITTSGQTGQMYAIEVSA